MQQSLDDATAAAEAAQSSLDEASASAEAAAKDAADSLARSSASASAACEQQLSQTRKQYDYLKRLRGDAQQQLNRMATAPWDQRQPVQDPIRELTQQMRPPESALWDGC